MKNIALLGSTGSIGSQVLDVVSALPHRLRVVSIAASRSVKLLADQVKRFRPLLASVGSKKDADELASLLGGPDGLHHIAPDFEIAWGKEGLNRAASIPQADITVVSVAGTVGLDPTLSAISSKKDVALASKEVLVAAGEVVVNTAKAHGVRILPIDSEHSAIFQCLQGEDPQTVSRIILTASGGAFANRPLETLESATVSEALAHPTWSMGPKITIDSATLMNKALEIIEAHWLFGVPPNKIEVVIHPQSVVHSMVEFCDGSILAQMGVPDMRLPIQYALFYPERVENYLPRLDVTAYDGLNFAVPDTKRYPALRLAYWAANCGGTLPAVMNAANEVAVHLFLKKLIRFPDIIRIVENVMNQHETVVNPDLDTILRADFWARDITARMAEASV